MAVDYIGRLVKLNLGASDEEWAAAIAVDTRARSRTT